LKDLRTKVENSLELPAQLKPEEVEAMRRLQRELEQAGYAVRQLALAPGGNPLAVVARREDGKQPLRTLIAACRTLLRASEEISLGERGISAEEAETLAAARLTLRQTRQLLTVKRRETVGACAHREMARAVEKSEDSKE